MLVYYNHIRCNHEHIRYSIPSNVKKRTDWWVGSDGVFVAFVKEVGATHVLYASNPINQNRFLSS